MTGGSFLVGIQCLFPLSLPQGRLLPQQKTALGRGLLQSSPDATLEAKIRAGPCVPTQPSPGEGGGGGVGAQLEGAPRLSEKGQIVASVSHSCPGSLLGGGSLSRVLEMPKSAFPQEDSLEI